MKVCLIRPSIVVPAGNQVAMFTPPLGLAYIAGALRDGGFDEVVVAAGVRPRVPQIPGIDHPKVVGYVDLLLGRRTVGDSVAILGAGGIGFDVAQFLAARPGEHDDAETWSSAWGIDTGYTGAGGLSPGGPAMTSPRRIVLLQRSPERFGRTLGQHATAVGSVGPASPVCAKPSPTMHI